MREISQLPEPDFSLLANVKDPKQRELVKSTLESRDYRLLEMQRRNRELQDDNRRLQRLEAVAARARAEADKANAARKVAEAARAEAEGKEKLERFGRIADRDSDGNVIAVRPRGHGDGSEADGTEGLRSAENEPSGA